MKTTSLFKGLLALVMALGMLTFVAPTVKADDDHRGGDWDSAHHYRRDNYGYWNDREQYHHFVLWHEHHGYWDNRNGVRVFINVD